MKSFRAIIPIIIVLTALLSAMPVLAKGLASPVLQTEPGGSIPSRSASPGNYCMSCHMETDPRLLQATTWNGSIERMAINPCPAASKIQEEMYYTERLLLGTDRLHAALPSRVDLSKLELQIAGAQQNYLRLLDNPVTSLDAYQTETRLLRYRLGKSYTQLTQLMDLIKRQNVLIFAGLVTLAVLVSLFWGLRNTKFIFRFSNLEFQFRRSWVRNLIFLALIFIFFALPIFRVPSAAVATTTPEEQERQTALDNATLAVNTAERAQIRAWTLARIGAIWDASDPNQAKTALESALEAAQEAKLDQTALWGEALAAQEPAAGVEIGMQKAVLVSADLDANRYSTWGLANIASEWADVDSQKAEVFLEDAQKAAQESWGIYRDLDLHLLAVTWASIDAAHAKSVAESIQEPAIRAWALREAGIVSGQSSFFEGSVQAARLISDPVQRSRALRETAMVSGDATLYQEAFQALESVDGADRAYALSDLAAASGDLSFASQIDPTYPAARAAAYLRMKEYQSAWDAALEISDPYDKARAQSEIASGWQKIELAKEIGVLALRDRALAKIAISLQDDALAEEIEGPYSRGLALTGTRQFSKAIENVSNLRDSYPLRMLAIALADQDLEGAFRLLESMDRETDKAAALLAIAKASRDGETFEKALGMALAARQSGDPLAPVEATLNLASAFAGINAEDSSAALAQAYEIATAIR